MFDSAPSAKPGHPSSIPRRAILLLALLLAPLLASAAAPPVPPPPRVEARAWLLVDFDSGRQLAGENVDARVEPASLTKLMTAYIVFSEIEAGTIRLDEPVTISRKAWKTGGSKMFVRVDTQVPVEDLLKGMIIQSGNDASVALAEHAAGSEDAFASLMNQYAERLGMTGTHFVNSTGLPDPDHYTTARDLATLARALIRDFPDHYAWYSTKKFTYNGIEQFNRNKLLWRDPHVDGLKTGHTKSAGYCLVASAKRDGMRLISVVLGTASENARARESQKLLSYGFRFFETHKLYDAGQALTEARIWKGAEERLPLGLAEPLYITIPRRQYDRLKAEMEIATPIIAPARKDQRFGKVLVSLDGEVQAERPLIALKSIPEGGLASRLLDEVKMMFE